VNEEVIRVLYVDDNILDRELVRDALHHADMFFEIVECGSKSEFESALNESPADIVLTDFDICGYYGLEVLSRVQERWPDVPVVLVTGTGSEETAVAAMKSGAADYIIKDPRSIAKLPKVINDILESLRFKREGHAADQSFRDSEERFRRAVLHAPVPVMIHAEGGEILAISHIWYQITGYTHDDIPTLQDWIEHAYGDRVQSVLRAIDTAYEGSVPYRVGEFSIRCADGRLRIWDFSSTPLGSLPDGRRCAVTIANDITERRTLEQQLRQAQKLEAVGRLAGGVAHDFNNMLQVILGYAALAKDELGQDQPHWLSMIIEAASRSANLTRQLLAFARAQPIEPQPVDLSKALPEMVRLLERIVEEEIAIDCRTVENLWPIEMDPAQMDSIIANMVINSRDAIDDGGRIEFITENTVLTADQCELAGVPAGEYVRLVVHDSGTGMNAEVLEHLFEPFYTTKEQGFGSGLGLSSVYGIVRQNGGSIRVESPAGEGTTFTILLPRFIPAAVPVAGEQHRLQRSPVRQVILLVEDDVAVLEITSRLLQGLGYQVVATSEPAHALELAHEGFDDLNLVMTDVVMPEMKGTELVEKLRVLIPGLPALFTSGYPMEVVSTHGVLHENVHFLPKPYTREKLEQKVLEALSGMEAQTIAAKNEVRDEDDV
jgi:PAS domain S-box-containing protein